MIVWSSANAIYTTSNTISYDLISRRHMLQSMSSLPTICKSLSLLSLIKNILLNFGNFVTRHSFVMKIKNRNNNIVA
jgi:hypothetical protein